MNVMMDWLVLLGLVTSRTCAYSFLLHISCVIDSRYCRFYTVAVQVGGTTTAVNLGTSLFVFSIISVLKFGVCRYGIQRPMGNVQPMYHEGMQELQGPVVPIDLWNSDRGECRSEVR